MPKNVVFLLHNTGTGASAFPRQMATLFGYSVFRIDTLGTLPPGGDVFPDLDTALADPRFIGWTWYFFDENAGAGLSEIGHQRDKAIYVFGDDVNGFDRAIDQLPGALVYLNSAFAATMKHPASEVAISAIVHRFYQVDV